ncbi:porin family protein [Winogradskyella sp.]|uniref:porin family protein n=1 Tax=Winogradskyella sp. TaxID=1883156 RepID=UPI003F6B8018
MKCYLFLFACLIGYSSVSQNINTSKNDYEKYREDQFYASVTYNLLNNKPSNVSQSGFSTGFHFGFIRDMPINKDRNFALGLGIGISTNSYNQNLYIDEVNKEYIYSVINESEINVSKNKFTTYLVEVPFELRWRTSTPTEYNFWRIYTGFKLGYLIYNTTKFNSNEGSNNLSQISDFNNLQYGLTLSVGYGTWNFHLYYGLNPILDSSAQLEDKSIDMKSIKIGLMFYIL